MAIHKKLDSVTLGSGNVFKDLGILNAEAEQMKVRLAVAIHDVLKEKRLTQVKAAKILGINQPKISALVNYQLDGFSVGRLMKYLNALGYELDIVIKKPKTKRRANPMVRAA